MIERAVEDLDYVVKTPHRRKNKQLCHVNMLKMYHARPDVVKTVNIPTVVSENEQKNKDSDVSEMTGSAFRLQNSSVIKNLFSINCLILHQHCKKML